MTDLPVDYSDDDTRELALTCKADLARVEAGNGRNATMRRLIARSCFLYANIDVWLDVFSDDADMVELIKSAREEKIKRYQ